MTRRQEKLTMTVPEVAIALGISRGVAYQEARRFEATGGKEGLPVIRMGHRLVVPVARLQTFLGQTTG